MRIISILRVLIVAGRYSQGQLGKYFAVHFTPVERIVRGGRKVIKHSEAGRRYVAPLMLQG